MSKQFTIITKDGSKWLRPVNPFDNNDPRFTSKEPFCILGMRPCSKTVCECDEWKKFEKNNPILPYIGSRPDGTVVYESEVTAITQARHKESSSLTWFNVYDNGNWDYYETRTAYTDAEPECPECGKYCSCPEEDIYDAVADYRRNHPEQSHDRHISDDYWRKRREAAERFIAKSPCDNDITPAQEAAYNAWHEIVKEESK